MTKSTSNKQRKPVRVVFCTFSSIYSSLVLTTLLQADGIKVVAIINSTRLLKPSYNGFTGSLKFIQTTGWRYATYLFFITDLFKLLQPISSLKSIHSLAKKNNIPLLDTIDINCEKEIQFTADKSPDILLSAHFNQLFKESVLALPKLAAINIHPSLLPNYKGVDPVFYALLAEEGAVGVTAHLIDATFDTGKILKNRSFATHALNHVFSHNIQLFKAGGEIAIEAIQRVIDNKSGDQQEGKGSYDSWPNRSLVKKLRKKGIALIQLRDYFKAINH